MKRMKYPLGSHCAVRGGSWCDGDLILPQALSSLGKPSYRYPSIGFRIIRIKNEIKNRRTKK